MSDDLSKCPWCGCDRHARHDGLARGHADWACGSFKRGSEPVQSDACRANALGAALEAAEARAAAWQRAFTDLTELPLRCEECALDGCNTDCECPCHAERAASIEQIKRHALAGEKGDGDEQG